MMAKSNPIHSTPVSKLPDKSFSKLTPKGRGFTRFLSNDQQKDVSRVFNVTPCIPKFPAFSGDEPVPKGECSYIEWRYEVKCCLSDPDQAEHSVLQAIRRSIRGTAWRLIIPLGETADTNDVLTKLDAMFGDVSTHGMVMQEFFNAKQSNVMPEKYIVDVDTGVDDAQALLLALACPDVEVLAITCVAGNCNVDQVCLNTLKVLSVCDRLDIPVYRGASRAMVGDKLEATHYHGMDGLGDANLDVEVSPDLVQKEHAVNALLSLVNKYQGEVTLVALAPLTNIALALRQDPDFGKKLKKVLVMGGNTEGRGNSLLCAEFNFASDPEAAYVILNELGTNIVIFPWEINLSTAVGQSWEWYEHWAQTDTAKGRFNRAIAKNIVHFQRIVQKRPIFRSCDLNAMAVAIDPNVVMETEDVYATVELHGKFTRGMMVVDWRGSLGKSPNITLVKRINTDLTRSLFDKML